MVVFPSLVKGVRLKIVCIMLRGFKSHRYHHAQLAQLGERMALDHVVVGSNPTLGKA